MIKNKLILVLCFVAAFAAGGAMGLYVMSYEYPSHARSWLESQLKLTDDQKDRMHKIWSGVDASREQYFDQRRADANERDKAIAALLTPEQKADYEKIVQDYNRKIAELTQARKQAFSEADERTKREVLTHEQARQYDELLKKRLDRGPGGTGHHGGPFGGEGGPPPGFQGSWTSPPAPGEMRSPAGGAGSRAATEESNTPHVGE